MFHSLIVNTVNKERNRNGSIIKIICYDRPVQRKFHYLIFYPLEKMLVVEPNGTNVFPLKQPKL